MNTLLLWLFLFIAGGVLFLIKTYPALKHVAYALPVLALFLFLFRTSPSPGGPHSSARFQEQLALVIGGQLAAAMEKQLPEDALVLVLHPEKGSSTYRQLQARQILEGIQNGFNTRRTRVIFHPVPDEFAVGLATLNQALSSNAGAQGIILVGLQIVTDDDIRNMDLPPMVLSDLGDPGSSEWALQNGVAVAALFEKDIGSLPAGKITPETYFSTHVELRTSADFK